MARTPKKILFLSGIDFKEKSIQVIINTPEAFAAAGWQVDYIVLRDTSKGGNYFYETPITPKGVNVFRSPYKGGRLLNKISNHTLRAIINKLVAARGVFQLYSQALELLAKQQYDVVYGYEHIGTLAVKRLSSKHKLNGAKTVSRFQGTWMSLYYKQKNKFKLLVNSDFKWAMSFKSDLFIMTNDGTQGDYILEQWNPDHGNTKFWVNGVNSPKINTAITSQISSSLQVEKKLTIISISRLEGWKRVDRGIDIIHSFIQKFPESKDKIKYIIVGDGVDKGSLEKRVATHKLTDQIHFTGAISHAEVGNYLNLADVFFSFYDLSNVGNPLLEAIRSQKIIMTLANGDTSKWITHLENGFIYNPHSDFKNEVAEDLDKLINDQHLKDTVKIGVKKLSEEKLWTWSERMDEEVNEVTALL